MDFSYLPKSKKDAKEQYRTRYFTGTECVHGHLYPRFTSNGNCVECSRILYAKWTADNLEKKRAIVRASQRKRRRDKPEIMRAIDKRRYLRKKGFEVELKKPDYVVLYERREGYAKDYKEKYPERANASIRSRRKSNWGRVREQEKRYQENLKKKDPDKYMDCKRARYNRYKARKLEAEGDYTVADICRIRKMQNNKCAVCKVPLNPKSRPHIDHIIPLFSGGSNDARNLQLLCGSCNQSKGPKCPIEFMQSRGFLI